MDDREKAESILKEALQEDPENHKLYLQLVDLEYQNPALNINKMIELFNIAINSSLSIEDRLLFSQRKLEFLEDFGPSIQRIIDAYDAHQKLVKENAVVKKRKAEEETAQNEAKKAKLAETEEATATAAATNGTTMNYTATSNGTAMNYAGMNPSQMQQPYVDPNMAYNYSQWQGYAGYGYGQHGWYNYQQQPS